ncbi:LacI family DNA-binding transcriptional regulator [Hymenobacter yonginensis]|uniref:LacI family DNA-binding transcriptional regulator n=1 Tax=Hymenobacter yonginensis TaxID=748197 RepID=A0ABY7PPN0_9BACT|nr:LacI family DNA-binding transcriptional regulator [Hymenobacter yonginensis]WBO85220.1 LacI family DNA-binding transcriptional regulator [Hymenobacter yonginensis]
MQNHRASIADLAKALNLSPSTVSRALNNHTTISAATRQRVQELAEQFNYHPNHLAASLRTGRSKLLGVLVPHIEGTFFASVVHGIETVASKAGFRVMICQSNEEVEQEKSNIDTLINAQVEGILVSLSRTTHDTRHFEKVRKRGIPLVFFDRMLETPNVNAVVLDDYQGAYQATTHLIEQGCRRIAHFAGPQHLNIYRNRRLGYLAALNTYGLPEDDALVITSDMKLADGTAGMAQLLALPPAQRPDGLFSASDFSLVGALQTLKAHGLQVPQDMLLAGFSNEIFTSFTEPRLTSVDQRCEQMGQEAVRLFLEILEVGTVEHQPRRVVLPPQLLPRESSVRP